MSYRPRTPAPSAKVLAAAQRLQLGLTFDARELVKKALSEEGVSVEGLQLLALAERSLGDFAAAAEALRQAIRLEPDDAALHQALGDALYRSGRTEAALASLAEAVRIAPDFPPAVRDYAMLLCAQGRSAEALQVMEPLAAAGLAEDEASLHAYAEALQANHRSEAAVAVRRRAVAAAPRSGVAEHNLAALLGDLGRWPEAAEAARRAEAKGLNAPETRLVLARALVGLDDLDGAKAALESVLAARPTWPEAHRDLAQLQWMRTGDRLSALAALDRVLTTRTDAAPLLQVKAKVLSMTGDAEGAAELLVEAAARTADPTAALNASRALAAVGRGGQALSLARRASAASPSPAASAVLVEALLAVGEAHEAIRACEAMLALDPVSKTALAYLATAARLVGDERYGALYDYDAFVRRGGLEAPTGWTHLSAYLSDLRSALHAAHRFKTHPFDQSLRHGSQASALFSRPDPAIQAFKSAAAPAIEAYIAALGSGQDPLRRENLGGYAYQGVWSVRLTGGSGRHVNHIHAEGWLSSACYIELPPSVLGEGEEGALTFGAPGITTHPVLPPDRIIRPEVGALVLFPSYMWHGTTPFTGDAPRVTIAFDLAPAARTA